MMRWFLMLFVAGFCFCGCGVVEVRVERYAPPVWQTDWMMKIKIAPMVGFGEPHRGLAADLAGEIGLFLKGTNSYASVELLPLASFTLMRGRDGEALLKPEEVKKLAKGADALLTVQVLHFASRVRLSRTSIGFGMGYGTPEWAVTGAFSPYDRWFARTEATVAFILYRAADGSIKERLICRKVTETPPLPSLPNERRLIADVFRSLKDEILCHLYIRHSTTSRTLIESPIPTVSYGIDAVLCGDIRLASEVFADAVRENDRSVEAHYNYAAVLESLGKYQEALVYYRAAQALAGGEAFSSEIEDVRNTIEAQTILDERRRRVEILSKQKVERQKEAPKQPQKSKPEKQNMKRKQPKSDKR